MLNTRDVRRLELRSALIGACLLVPAYLIGRITDVLDGLLSVAWLLGVLLLGGSIAHVCWKHTHLAQRRRHYHAPGWASQHDFAHVIGRRALLRLARFIRPSLAKRTGLDRFRRRRATDYGIKLGKAVTGNVAVRRRKVYVSYEKCSLIVAPQGAGKTSLLLHQVLDAPGALLTATTKPDLYTYTSALRAQQGPIALFNPQNIAELPSDFAWDPLIGCEHYQAATDRASALVRGTKAITGMDEQSWGEKCVDIVSKYLMAARLAEKDMNAVAGWLADPNNEEAVQILRYFDGYAPPGWAEALEAELRSDATRMKGSIWSLARGSVAFMANPEIARVCQSGAESFDAAEFARSAGTLYLLGDDKDETIAPLLNALTSYVYDAVKARAVLSPGQRLDPPFGFLLDEAAKITPVPLGHWARDARGFGMYIIAILQAFAQLRQRWGQDGAEEILALFARIVLSGIQNPTELEELSKLIGTRPGELAVADFLDLSLDGHPPPLRREPIIRPEDIRMLPRGHALAVIGEARAVILKYPKGHVRAEKELNQLRKRPPKGSDPAARGLPAPRDEAASAGFLPRQFTPRTPVR